MFGIRPFLRQAWRESGRVFTRVWYDSPGTLMVAYLVLGVAADAIASRADLVSKYSLYGWICVLTFFCWRVSRRGWISRGILIYISAAGLLKAAGLAQSWHPQALAMVAINLVELMLLLSPAVYARTHPSDVAVSSSIRLRPSRWIALSAPLAGTGVAGLTVAVTRRWGLPGRGCMIDPVEGLPSRCVGVGRGFPVPVVAAVHGHHTVSQLAFVQDCAQWTLLLFTAGYLLWLALHRRQAPVPHCSPEAGFAAQPSQ